MLISQLTDNLPDRNLHTLVSNSLDDKELLSAVANLLYATKDVKTSTKVINNAALIVSLKLETNLQESTEGC